MKRKREGEHDDKRERPFQKREELLNTCICLVLRYNTEFRLNTGDLTLYRYAESLSDIDDIHTFNRKIYDSITSQEYKTLEELCQVT